MLKYIQESLAKFENRIKPWVYIRRITRSTMVEKAPFFSWKTRQEISFEACEFSPIKIDFSDYPESLISRINVNFNKILL